MKGVILAGGTGTRLGILTKVVNKHLLPIYDKPMIMYPLNTLINFGIKSIMIVTDKGRAGDFMKLLGSGREYGVKFTYGLQDDPAGIPDAISIARDFANNSDIIVILGDNIFFNNVSYTDNKKNIATLFLKKVKDPKRFGVAKFDGNKIVDIIEKPEDDFSKMVVTGLYKYPPDIFEKIESLSKSERNELEVTDLNKILLQENRLNYKIIKNAWYDAGTVESLIQAQNMAKKLSINHKKQGI